MQALFSSPLPISYSHGHCECYHPFTPCTISLVQSPTDKLIRELREENARLIALLAGGSTALPVLGGLHNEEHPLSMY